MVTRARTNTRRFLVLIVPPAATCVALVAIVRINSILLQTQGTSKFNLLRVTSKATNVALLWIILHITCYANPGCEQLTRHTIGDSDYATTQTAKMNVTARLHLESGYHAPQAFLVATLEISTSCTTQEPRRLWMILRGLLSLFTLHEQSNCAFYDTLRVPVLLLLTLQMPLLTLPSPAFRSCLQMSLLTLQMPLLTLQMPLSFTSYPSSRCRTVLPEVLMESSSGRVLTVMSS